MLVTTLKGYLAETNTTVKDFAKIVDCNDKYLSRIMIGTMYPSKFLAKEIYRQTNGIVKLSTNPNTKTNKKQNEDKNEKNPD